MKRCCALVHACFYVQETKAVLISREPSYVVFSHHLIHIHAAAAMTKLSLGLLSVFVLISVYGNIDASSRGLYFLMAGITRSICQRTCPIHCVSKDPVRYSDDRCSVHCKCRRGFSVFEFDCCDIVFNTSNKNT